MATMNKTPLNKPEREALYLSLPAGHRRRLLACEDMQEAFKVLDGPDFEYLTERERCGLAMFFPLNARAEGRDS